MIVYPPTSRARLLTARAVTHDSEAFRSKLGSASGVPVFSSPFSASDCVTSPGVTWMKGVQMPMFCRLQAWMFRCGTVLFGSSWFGIASSYSIGVDLRAP
jgi:hypothetical protein